MKRLPKHILPTLVFFTLMAELSACAPSGGGQVGEENFACLSVEDTVLDPSQESPLGFAAEQILSAISGTHQLPLTWADGGATSLTLELSSAGAITFQDREWVDSETGTEAPQEIGLEDCEDVVEIEMLLGLQTDDGGLNESWSVRVLATSANNATTTYAFDAVTGSLDIASYALEQDVDAVSAYVDVEFVSGVPSGSISGQSESSDGATVSSTGFEIATFGP